MRGRLAAAAYLASLSVLGGCGGGGDEGGAAHRRSDGQKQLGGAPLFGGSLQAGKRYRTRVFRPALSFVVQDANWAASKTDARTLLILDGDRGRPGSLTPPKPVFVVFQRYTRVYEPDRPGDGPASLRPAPRDLAAWLRNHPDLSVGRASPARVGGLRGRQLDATVTTGKPRHSSSGCRGPCVALAPDATFAKGMKVRFIVLDAKGPPLAAPVEAFPRDFARFSARAQRVLDSVRFVGTQ
jgi:hypothetical protein